MSVNELPKLDTQQKTHYQLIEQLFQNASQMQSPQTVLLNKKRNAEHMSEIKKVEDEIVKKN